ncbi:MAG TPA: hypothetical protein VHF89_12715 [Solirubrobacteraceae bacterium]|nr:hypothetical protein [Solirubrobacteraceae bacterium]
MTADEPIDVVLTAGDLDRHVVAARELLHRTAAIEVQAVVDRGADRPAALITCGRMRPIEVTEGERTVHLPHTAELDAPAPELPQVPRLPPIEVDPAGGTVSAPLGAIPALADAVGALAAALGGRSVALAFFQTTDDETPLGIAARTGEPVLLTLGDDQFALPA